MTLAMWRNTLHKFIVVIGFMALITIANGNNIGYSSERILSDTDSFKQNSQISSLLLKDSCEYKSNSWLDALLLFPAKQNNEVCTIKEEQDEYDKRLTYIQR